MNGNWISVEDRLPDYDKYVLGYNGFEIIVCWLDVDYDEWYTDTNMYLTNITHWQPLPNPPKEND